MQFREQDSSSASCFDSKTPSTSNVGSGDRVLHHGYVLVLFLAFSTLIRLPWFFQDIIDGDEGTFILVGKALVDGYLPGTLVLDLKPPLGFVFFALILSVVPDSLAAIRLGGALWVAASAFLVFRISLKMMPLWHSLINGFTFIIAASLLTFTGQAVLTEHIALVPLLGALLLTISGRQSLWTYLAIGALLAAATLVRLNLAYLAVAVVVVTPLLWPATELRDRLVAAFWIGIGGVLALGALYLPYGLLGHTTLFVDIFKVPFAYSGSHLDFTQTFWAMVWGGLPYIPPAAPDFGALVSPREILRLVFWTMGAVGLVSMAILRWQREYNRAGLWLAVYAGAISYSLLASGQPWDHYLIHLMPLYAIGVGSAVCLFRSQSGRVSAVLTALLIVSATQQVWPSYQRLADRLSREGGLYHGSTFELVAHLKQIARPGDTYFFEGGEIAYWLLNTYPVTPIAGFSGNIWNEKGIVVPLFGPDATKESVLEHIISLAPDVIVLKDRSFEYETGFRVYPNFSGFGAIPRFREALWEHYTLESEQFERLIFRRKSGADL